MCACLHDACTHDACMQDVGTYEACIYFACTCDACKKWGRTDERTDGKLNSRSTIMPHLGPMCTTENVAEDPKFPCINKHTLKSLENGIA